MWRQFFMTGRDSGRRIESNFGRNFLGTFVLHWLCRTTHQNFSPNSSQFITPCLVTAPVTEISKFHLRELLGLGVPKESRDAREMLEIPPVKKDPFRIAPPPLRSRRQCPPGKWSGNFWEDQGILRRYGEVLSEVPSQGHARTHTHTHTCLSRLDAQIASGFKSNPLAI